MAQAYFWSVEGGTSQVFAVLSERVPASQGKWRARALCTVGMLRFSSHRVDVELATSDSSTLDS